MKKIFIILFLLNLWIMPSFAFELFQKSNNTQIKSFFKEYAKAFKSYDIEKIKTFYDKDYKSSDGFSLDELAEMIDKTHKTYKNIKYKTKLNSINAYDNWALVQISDSSFAKVYPTEIKEIKKEKMGKLEGKSVSNVYLKKIDDVWKIAYDEILMEETSLKYGLANKVDMNLITPMNVKNGAEYELSLQIDKPKDIIALASLSREEVVYPPVDYQEKFRKISDVGELERVVRANNKNIDEYAIASVGLTKVTVDEQLTKARIQILGIAYIMKRINMDTVRKNTQVLVENK